MLIRSALFPLGVRFQSPADDGQGGNGSGGSGGNNGGQQGNQQGGGNNGGDDVQRRIDEAVSGLKRTNEALKEEKTGLKKQFDELKAQIDALGGSDGLKQLQDLNAKFATDELGKLLKEGKHDEWFDRRAKSLRDEHAKQLGQHDTKVKQAEERAAKAEQKLQRMMLTTAVQAAAVKAGVEPTAIEDISEIAANRFQFDPEKGQLVLKDSDGVVVFGKDGKSPKSVEEWLEDQRESRRHWWAASTSGGASGSGRSGSTGPTKYSDDPAEYQRQRRAEMAAKK